MKTLKTSYKIEKKNYSFFYKGKTFRGPKKTLIEDQDNLLENVKFDKKGYGVVNFDKTISHSKMKKFIEKLIKRLIKKHSKKKINNFRLEKYHLFVDLELHYKIIKDISQGIKFTSAISRIKLENFMSKILKINVSTLNKKFTNKNHKYYLDPKRFNLRIIRPLKNDFNPPHRDAYFDNHANGVNIYIPIAGSNKKSSLPVFPKSHQIKESDVLRTKLNTLFNGIKFSVPVIVKTKPKIKLIRPDPKNNQLLLFSSNIIHGGGLNDNKNITRVSIELRFWRL
tara:strand:+ start:1228 stop:2073 length:846 start_codon:yes stop_codon:yes gene_type:complete